jgi:DNA replication licensing factor MCM4
MMELIHNRSEFEDKQIVRLQETPGPSSSSIKLTIDVVPDGQTPHSVSICFYDELVDIAKPGDRIAVTGIFRSVPVRVNPRRRTIKALFKTYLDVTHIAKTDAKRLGIDTSTLDTELREQQAETDQTRRVSQEERSKILEISTRHDVYDLLARSIAPSIWEMDDVKKGILLQLFGGTNKVFLKGGGPRYRGDINILLCGDPSTSKSQILQVFLLLIWLMSSTCIKSLLEAFTPVAKEVVQSV